MTMWEVAVRPSMCLSVPNRRVFGAGTMAREVPLKNRPPVLASLLLIMDAVKRISTLLIKFLIQKRVLVVGAGVGVSALMAGPAGALAAGSGIGSAEVLTAVGLSLIPSVLLSIIPALTAFRWGDVRRALDDVKQLLLRVLRTVFGSGSGKEIDYLNPRIDSQ